MRVNGRFLSLSLIPAVLLLDRLSKIAVTSRLAEGESVPVLSGVFHFTRVDNTGAAFGLFKNGAWWLAGVSAVAVAVLAAGFRERSSHPRALALALVIGGALGNLYDRLVHGYVIDFLDFRIWPVFNLADTAITCGMLLMALELLRRR